MRRLRDDQWDWIKDFLPGRDGRVGGTAADNRLFVEAVLFRFRAGVPWRDLPGRVAEPSTWVMMILGFAGVGFIPYRRRNSAMLAARVGSQAYI